MFDRFNAVPSTNWVAALAGAKTIRMERAGATSADMRRRILEDELII